VVRDDSWGQALCLALDALLKWLDLKQTLSEGVVRCTLLATST
jgi:hypothetical protein